MNHHSQNDTSNTNEATNCRPQHHRSSFLSASAIACLLVLNNTRGSIAFPTNGPHRPLSVKVGVPSHQSINHRSAVNHNYNGCWQSTIRRTTTAYSSMTLQAVQRKDELAEEFQRSLLEAKIANDIKDTIVKDEMERNEIVTKKIDAEKEELQDAVKEVKEAVVEVSQSAKNLGEAVTSQTNSTRAAAKEISKSATRLGGTFITKGPRLLKRQLTLLATGEFRYVSLTLSACCEYHTYINIIQITDIIQPTLHLQS